MSETTVVTTDDSGAPTNLPDRLDTAIGDASSGIGLLMSELVRRSLRTGVADIERTLTDVTAEKVELAVELQMPAISETAHRVAESTSSRVVNKVVTESEQRSNEQLKTAVGEVNESIRDQQDQHNKTAQQTSAEIEKLNTRARSTWKKVKQHFDVVDAESLKLQKTVRELSSTTANLQSDHQTHEQQLQNLIAEKKQLESNLQKLFHEFATLGERFQQQEATVQELQEHGQSLERRLLELEKPRGVKGLWQKFRGRKDSTSDPADSDSE